MLNDLSKKVTLENGSTAFINSATLSIDFKKTYDGRGNVISDYSCEVLTKCKKDDGTIFLSKFEDNNLKLAKELFNIKDYFEGIFSNIRESILMRLPLEKH